MADNIDEEFVRVLESHHNVPNQKALTTIRDPSFAVLGCVEDAPFFAQMANVLNSDPQIKKSKVVNRKLTSAMKSFLAAERRSPAARRAVVTASLSLFRHSCGLKVPATLAAAASHAVLKALAAISTNPAATSTVTHGAAAASKHTAVAHHPGISSRSQQRVSETTASASAAAAAAAAASTSPGMGERLTLGAEGFPESQIAAFLLDATRAEPPPPPTPPIAVPADVAVKILFTFGVGGSHQDALEWGSPSVSDCLRGSVRRISNRLWQEGKWDLGVELVQHMATSKGVEECEGVLGQQLGELVASAMLHEEWESARRLVSTAAKGGPRQTMARALIPAAADAEAFDVAAQLIEDNHLVSEFPEYHTLLEKSWLQKKKQTLARVVKKPGWKMAQQMVDRRSRYRHELAVWLVEHMIELRNLPAAATLMDHFNLHNHMPPLDPALVEASARERAAAHLQLPISTSRVVVVDSMEPLRYAQRVLSNPPTVGGSGDFFPGVRCVGLDVENCPTTNRAVLLQVATSTNVFLFDLMALLSRRASREVVGCFDTTVGELMSNPAIVKLGFSFDQDAGHLRKTCPDLRGLREIVALLEVAELSFAFLGSETASLTKTCEAWLGKPLDKTECTSTWTKRPLTMDQIKYAALDAHCLVGIFEEILIEKRNRLSGRGGTAVVAMDDRDPGEDPHAWWRRLLVSNVEKRSNNGSSNPRR